MHKITTTVKQIKDLVFLLGMPKQQVNPGIVKRKEVQGRGEVIQDIKAPLNVFISFQKYNCQGKFVNRVVNLCIKNFNKGPSLQIPEGVYQCVQTMKVQEKSWFNIQKLNLQSIQKGIQPSQKQTFHFYITVEDVKYKNSDTIQSKKCVSESLRKQAKELFQKGDYSEALKRYKREINISEGVDKKKFKQNQLLQIEAINKKAKRNFLKCFVKLTNFDEALSDLADKYSKQFLKENSQQINNLYLRSLVLMQRKYITQAIQIARQVQNKSKQEGSILIRQIQQRIQKKK